MHLDGARTDPAAAASLLAGCSRHDLAQHVLLAPGQWLAAGKMERGRLGGARLGLATALRFDRFPHPRHDFAAAKRLFDEVERAVPDGVDRHRDVALAG